MNKSLFLAVATLAMASSAHADEIVQKFEGPYAGLSTGINVLTIHNRNPSSSGDVNWTSNGFMIGLDGGYQTHINSLSPQAILGVEIGGTYAFTSGHTADITAVRQGEGSLTIRPGYQVNPSTELYAVAGGSVARFGTRVDVATANSWTYGGVLGAGMESYLTDTLSARLEAIHAIYASYVMPSATGGRNTPSETDVKLGLGYHF